MGPLIQAEPGVLLAWLIFAATLVGMVGCGPKSELLGVSGEVSLDGTPLKSGSIELSSVNSDKLFASGTLIEHGNYEIPQAKGLPPGKYLVVINAADESAPRAPGGGARELIPMEYNVSSQVTVDLTVDGENHFPFDIVSKK